MMNSERNDAHSIAQRIQGQIEPVVERISHSSLFSRLIVDRLGLVIREADGALGGIGRYLVYYAPAEDWASAHQNQSIGEWIYGEWSRKTVDKVLDSGEILTGTRLVVAQGSARKAGNGTGLSFSRVAVGLVQSMGDVPKFIHFVAAVNMIGVRSPNGACEEHEFFSAISGFITKSQNNLTVAQYPLPTLKGGKA